MLSLGYIAVMATEVAYLLVVVPGHLGILLVYLHDFIRQKGLDIKDQLFCGLSICYPLHAFWQVIFDLIPFLDVSLFGMFFDFFVMFMVELISMSCILFFSTWLSVYFCLKIVNLNIGWYICLQRRFPKIFPWLLLVSVLASILCSFPLAFYASEFNLAQNTTMFSLLINGAQSPSKNISFLVSMRCYIMISLLWFMLFFISSCPIVVSLYQHMRRIQVSTAGSRIPTLEPHIYAVKTITLLMIINALYIFSLILLMLNEFRLILYYGASTIFKICHIASLVISIRGNQKVRNKLEETIHYLLGMRALPGD